MYIYGCRKLFGSTAAYNVCYRFVASTSRSVGLKEVAQQTANSAKTQPGLRINRCFPQYSRTEADRLVESGRVTVNGVRATLGTRLLETDVVMLDNAPVQWQELVGKQLSSKYPEGLRSDNGFVYIKYWKDAGVNTTTSPRDPAGVLNTGHFKNLKMQPPAGESGTSSKTKGTAKEAGNDVSRLLAVGRLDQASTGVLLLTSDARLPAWLLGANTGCSKVYEVRLDRPPSAAHLKRWSSGITLSTPSSSGAAVRTHPTLPCKVRLLAQPSPAAAAAAAAASDSAATRTQSTQSANASAGGAVDSNNGRAAASTPSPNAAAPAGCWVEFTLKEGRNRQIRRMVHALGYTVLSLHRSAFCGVGGAGLRKPGDWAHLTDAELRLLQLRK